MITKTKVLKFGKESWKKPVVYQLAKEFNISFSILKAKVLPRQEGVMILELSGTKDEFERGMEYLETSGVWVGSIEQEILYDETVCTNCGACTGFCPSNALYIKDRETMEIAFNHEECIGCELCLVACPSRALSQAEDIAI